MGIPYRKKRISVIRIAIYDLSDVIKTLSGQIRKLPNVSAITAHPIT